jgi:hypothetical protein
MIAYLRYILGWSKPTNVPQESCVIVCGHTSYWDGIITVLYRSEIPCVALIKPQLLEGFLGPFLKWLGFIPAPKLEDRGAGGVQQIVATLRALQATSPTPIRLLISPKGTIQNRPWRTGYQHIAKELEWPIKVLGVDYSKRSLTIVDSSGTDIPALQQQLGQFCPLVPSRCEYPILCDYDSWELHCPMDLILISNLCMLGPAFQALWFNHIGIFTQTMITLYISWIYHLSRESQYVLLDSLIAKAGAVYWLYTFRESLTLMTTILVAVPAIRGLYHYQIGTPRISGVSRGNYIYHHTLFHLWMSIAAWLLVVRA